MTHRPSGFQFSIVGVPLTTAVAAGALAVLVDVPPVFATPIILFLSVALPALLTTRVVYASGYQRTFCIGALFPAGLGLFVVACIFGLLMVRSPPANLKEAGQWLAFFEKWRSFFAFTPRRYGRWPSSSGACASSAAGRWSGRPRRSVNAKFAATTITHPARLERMPRPLDRVRRPFRSRPRRRRWD